jgi:hypothetical protein
MDKFFLAVIATAGTAFAALAPAGAFTTDLADRQPKAVIRARTAWRADGAVPGCRVEMRWKRDYAGQLYLKKVRVCA